MQARVKWVEGLTFLGESASGHQILMDGNSGDKAPSPMEMVLMAAGGCSAIDVVSILQKGRHDVTGCEVKLTAERADFSLVLVVITALSGIVWALDSLLLRPRREAALRAAGRDPAAFADPGTVDYARSFFPVAAVLSLGAFARG